MCSARRGPWPLVAVCPEDHNPQGWGTLKVVIDIIDVFSEGIDCKRPIRPSKYGGKVQKVMEKERNEQADLLRKEVMTSIDGLED